MTKNEARQLVEIAEFGLGLFDKKGYSAYQLESYIMGAYKTACRFQEDGGQVRTTLGSWTFLDMEEKEDVIGFRESVEGLKTIMEDDE